ncbi:type II secretion system protein GspM [Candidatus Entotheonella palauensis]|uniref:type II secretion system protein GspM n=1 Tax=Candidatus Entotheonella palauensis TaxID=93172 RepID=UPI000B7CB031|nr:type II secretion system protein GspM [Candidatus Entotheonella palauensis]
MSFFQTLQLREKFLVVCAAVAVVLFLLFMLVIDPVLDRSARLDRQIRKAEEDLKKLNAYRREYAQQKRILDSLNTRLSQPQNEDIQIRLAKLARETGTSDNITDMTPSTNSSSEAYTEESVAVQMADVTLEQLAKYLYKIEQSRQFLIIKRLTIKPRLSNRQLLTASFRVSTFTPKKGSRF